MLPERIQPSDDTSRLFEEAHDELFSHLLRSDVRNRAPEGRRDWLADTLAYFRLRYRALPDARLRELGQAAQQFLRIRAA